MSIIEEYSPHQTDGKWLESLTTECAPLLAEWDCTEAWRWDDWPDRHGSDIGIDVVAKRADGGLIAIQCKSRQLDAGGEGKQIPLSEITKFVAAAPDKKYAELWLVVNGAVDAAPNAKRVMDSHKITHVNLRAEIQKQLSAMAPDSDGNSTATGTARDIETRNAMQGEAVRISSERLRELAAVRGDSRGRIILPCGTGKSRVALRIIESLTEPGEAAAILCPSIALVAQLRGEFLMNSDRKIAALAVCSDQTAAQGSDLSVDQTADLSQTSARDVKGRVTTDADEISEWIGSVPADRIGVIFGTYQSSFKIGEALTSGNHRLAVLVADEAHRTAGIKQVSGQEKRLRDFAVCHDQNRFPSKYRVYQTATPKVYRTPQERKADQRLDRQGKWVVRSMDDENMFGPELYRRSYKEAVENGWLSDYRIIALGVNDAKAYGTANRLAGKKGSALSTAHVIRGLALALVKGGATREYNSAIRSSINFLNTIKKSKQMTEVLQSRAVRDWVAERLKAIGIEGTAPVYRLRHLDAKSNVAQREEAKAELASATDEQPRGILNVGIFGEGTDAPSLSAVGFIEPRKSPVDVIQAVGRVMRRSPGKEIGYIFCPIVIPPKTDAERWLAVSNSPDDGWQPLGQILLALRAHDERIEDQLSDLMEIYLPSDTEAEGDATENTVSTVVAISSENGRARYYVHEGKPGEARAVAADCAEGKARPSGALWPLNEAIPDKETAAKQADGREPPARRPKHEPEFIVTARPAAPAAATEQVQDSGQTGAAPSPASPPPVAEVREQLVERDKPKPDGTRGPINVKKIKQTARKMLNGQTGRKIANPRKRPSPEQKAFDLLEKSGAEKMGIYVNLLEKSGLCRTPAARSVNLLQEAIAEAKLRLAEDELEPALARHFVLGEQAKSDAADGCTIAALLLMNAAMLHQRIVAGGWLPTVRVGLDQIKSAPNAKRLAHRQWNHIKGHDFRPVIEPAIEVIEAIEDTGRESGLNKAIRHIAGEAERLAEDYAELGADYAGELFNKVMGNQTSDGAFFTRPAAATLLAGLALDAAMPDDADWTDKTTWRECRMVDLACGSGTLLAAALAEMKRRAREQGAKQGQLAAFQKIAVEDTIAGLDFNPVSLQLAAAQLTAGNTNVAYRRMGLHRMAYGPDRHTGRAAAGSLELLTQRRIIGLNGELDLGDQGAGGERLRTGAESSDDPLLENAVEAAADARIVIMNPPFTERTNMGEKFAKEEQLALRERVDEIEQAVVQSDSQLEGFVSKRSIGPLFEALAEKCAENSGGVVAMVRPTIVLTGPAALRMRQIYAKRLHIDMLITSHRPGKINFSQNTAINETLLIARRLPSDTSKPPTRIVNLDRIPTDEHEAGELRRYLAQRRVGDLPERWGQVSEWPAERVQAGDWTAGAFRSPILAEAAYGITRHPQLATMQAQGMRSRLLVVHVDFERVDTDAPGAFPLMYSKGADAQQTIRGRPDQHWAAKQPAPESEWVEADDMQGPQHPLVARRIAPQTGHLLVSGGQRTSTARLTAVAQDRLYVGVGWMPVPDVTLKQAQAAAVFLNSTAGRLQFLRNPGTTLDFPKYRPAGLQNITLPNMADESIIAPLAACWDATADTLVPQYRDGECEVRRLWDEAVCTALGWDAEWMAGLRRLLHREPHVCGVGRGEVVDAD